MSEHPAPVSTKPHVTTPAPRVNIAPSSAPSSLPPPPSGLRKCAATCGFTECSPDICSSGTFYTGGEACTWQCECPPGACEDVLSKKGCKKVLNKGKCDKKKGRKKCKVTCGHEC